MTLNRFIKHANDYRNLYCGGSAKVSLDELERADNNIIERKFESCGKCVIVNKGKTVNKEFIRRDMSTVEFPVCSTTEQLKANGLTVDDYVKGEQVKDLNGVLGHYRPSPNDGENNESQITIRYTKDVYNGFPFVKRTKV